MTTCFNHLLTWSRHAMLALACCAGLAQAADLPADTAQPAPLPVQSTQALAPQLQVGDLVFIRLSFKPFLRVASDTGSWTNHVGIVTRVDGAEPEISESAVPRSRRTTLARFAARSDNGRLAVLRLQAPLTPEQQHAVAAAAARRMGVWYDTGFNLHSSNRQFCSRFVREVLLEATGAPVGEVQSFTEIFAQRPGTDLGFWKIWYFGSIPWQRETVTPASVLNSDKLHTVFDGRLTPPAT